MTFLAMKRNLPIRAAAVVGAVYDAEVFGTRAPGMLADAAKLIPDYAQNGPAALQQGSVMNCLMLSMLHYSYCMAQLAKRCQRQRR
jgi:hypothetical protein